MFPRLSKVLKLMVIGWQDFSKEEIAKLKNIIKLNKQFINELQIINQNLKLDNEEYLRDKINYDQIINKNNNSLKNKILRKLKNKVLKLLFNK